MGSSETSTHSFIQLLKWWFVSLVFVAPVISGVYYWLKDWESFEIIFLSIFFSIFFSLPCLSVLCLISFWPPMQKLSIWTTRIIYTILGLTGVSITLYLIGGSMSPDLIIIYSLSVLFGSFLVPIRPTNRKENEANLLRQ